MELVRFGRLCRLADFDYVLFHREVRDKGEPQVPSFVRKCDFVSTNSDGRWKEISRRRRGCGEENGVNFVFL